MNELKPESVLDLFLKYFNELPDLHGKTISQIKIDNEEYSLRQIQEITGKLKRDGYISFDYYFENNIDKSDPSYASTFEGKLFHSAGGYVAKSLADVAYVEQQTLEIARLKSVDVSNDQNQTRLNKLTNRVFVATLIASVAALAVLCWQIWIHYHPETVPLNVYVNIEKKP